MNNKGRNVCQCEKLDCFRDLSKINCAPPNLGILGREYVD